MKTFTEFLGELDLSRETPDYDSIEDRTKQKPAVTPKPGGTMANRPGGVSVKPTQATVNRPPIGGLKPGGPLANRPGGVSVKPAPATVNKPSAAPPAQTNTPKFNPQSSTKYSRPSMSGLRPKL